MLTIIILTPDPMDNVDWEQSFNEIATAFQKLEVNVLPMPWTNAPSPHVDSSTVIYVANLVWSYHLRGDQWKAWLQSWPKNVPIFNSPQTLQWNTVKTYLRDLESVGVPVIPTLYVTNIDESTIHEAAMHFSASDLIIKPQISASSHNTLRVLVGNDRFDLAPKSMSINQAISHLRKENVCEPMIIQPFIQSIYAEGEISVIVFNGKVSHAVRKNVSPTDFRCQSEYGGKYSAIDDISPEIQKLVRLTIDACPEVPVYARVDILRNDFTSELAISELELIEPGLLLKYAADSSSAFAQAVLEAARKTSINS